MRWQTGLHSITKTAIERFEDALREIATLFVALAPLDVALGARGPHAIIYGLIFVTGGVILFMWALYIERIRHNA